MLNQGCFIQDVKSEYQKKNASSGASRVFDFKSLGNTINLNVPDEGVVTTDGWKIELLTPPNVPWYDKYLQVHIYGLGLL